MTPWQKIRDSRKLLMTYLMTGLGIVMAFGMVADFSDWALYQAAVIGIYAGSNVAQKYSPNYSLNTPPNDNGSTEC